MWALAFAGAVGCGGTNAAAVETAAPAEVYSFTPSPLLELARSEREVPSMGLSRPRRQAIEAAGEAETEADTELDEDGIRRTVRVEPRGLATHEDLLRAALRDAESRRPRELHPMRFLVRASRVRAGSAKRRAYARSVVDSRDASVALCLVEEVSSRSDVILRAPAALVLEEAARTGPITYGISIAFHGQRDPSITVDPPVNERTATCLTDALRPKPSDDLRSARVALTAFSQHAWGIGHAGAHKYLANEAAILGWIELERGEYDGALAFFEDAFWLYHRPEYELLQAMALQKMGRPNMAVTRYRRFIEARPHAPETPMLRERVAQLVAARERD